MSNKMKAWREASRRNTINGELTPRQWKAGQRDFSNRTPSVLLLNLIARID